VQRREALRGVDLDVERGEILGIVGDKGSGKTTLLRCAAGLLRWDGGTIHLDGSQVSVGRAQLDLLYVHAIPAYYPFLTVRDVLARHVRRESTRLGCTRAIERVAHRLSLADLLTTTVSALAIDELKRVAIAEAVLEAPKLILFDGTLDALDEASFLVNSAIEDQTRAGQAVIVASRNAAIGGRVATRIALMEAGRVAASFAAEVRPVDLPARSVAFADVGARVRQIAERVH
jgi:D-methionine transport system ATP-binding protein